MSPCEAGSATPKTAAEDARTRVGTALSLLELAAEILESVPPPETAFPAGDRDLYRYLRAAAAAKARLVGEEAGDGVDRPARGSALGDGKRIYEWSAEESERHFLEGIHGWSGRQ